MVTSFNNKTISAVYSVLPSQEVDFLDEARGSDIQVHLTGVSITQNGDNIPTGDICRHHE